MFCTLAYGNTNKNNRAKPFASKEVDFLDMKPARATDEDI
jgi:hypothetical protein